MFNRIILSRSLVLCPVEFTKGHLKSLYPKVSPRGEGLIHSLKLKDTL